MHVAIIDRPWRCSHLLSCEAWVVASMVARDENLSAAVGMHDLTGARNGAEGSKLLWLAEASGPEACVVYFEPCNHSAFL